MAATAQEMNADCNSTALPLAGVKVLELGTMITAPYSAMTLAELGASVIKVENPEGGDPFRGASSDRYGPNFIAYNHSKRSITLDLKTAEGLDALEKLIAATDVLVENYRSGVMEKFGLTSDRLRDLNARLIHCSITGFGADGPYSGRPAYDAVASALSGIYGLAVDPQDPRLVGITVADNVTGLYAANGILAALYQRERSGRGRRIEINMLESAIAFSPDAFAHYDQTGVRYGPSSRVAASQCFAFNCADGKLLTVHLSLQAKFWNNLLAALGNEDLAADPRFQDRSQRVARYDELRTTLADIFKSQTRVHWMARLDAGDVPFAPIHTIPEVMEDAQVTHLDTFEKTYHPHKGHVTTIRSPIRLAGSVRANAAPPALGEHTAEIMKELRAEAAPATGKGGVRD